MAYQRYGYRRKKGFFEKLSLTNIIILINIAVFLVIWIGLFFGLEEVVINYFALNASLFFKGYVWAILTSMFMHVLPFHLFANMVSLFFIGSFIERLIGRRRYLWFYMISGLVASLFFVGLAYLGQFFPGGERIFGGFDVFALGASGAIFGLGGLLAVLIPKLRVLFFFVIPMPIWLAMGVFLFGFWAASISAGWPIGNTAHLGGLVVGVVYGFYLRKKYSRKVRMLNRMFGR